MASFYAELQVAGHTYPVRRCSFAFHQLTDPRGRVHARVRHEPLHLLLDVPDDDALLHWASTPHKPQAGQVVFYETARRIARETLAFAAGECVGYAEAFDAGDAGDGAYRCQLVITAPAFELRVGGPAAVADSLPKPAKKSLSGVVITIGSTVAAAATKANPVAAAASALLTQPLPAAVATAAGGAAAPPEYTFDEFRKTIWDADQVDSAVIEQLYNHFCAAKASANPAPHWAAMETLIRSTTHPSKKPGRPDETLNGGWPPANGGFNKRTVQPAPPDTFDRYQKEAKVDPVTGAPILAGTFTSPIPPGGAFDYEARALEGKEDEYDLMYEVKILKPLPFKGEEADIIPWHGHVGNGVQTKMLFPPFDPALNDYPWDWKKLEQEGYVKITYKSSPNGKFNISPDGTQAILK